MMDGAGGEMGWETVRKRSGRGTWCCKQVGGRGCERVERESIWGACETSQMGSIGWALYKAKREVACP